MLRRNFIKMFSAGLSVSAIGPATVFAAGRHDIVPAQLLLRGQEATPYPSALRSMMIELMKRTSIDADLERMELRIDSDRLFRYPFIYIAGRDAYGDFTSDEIERLRALLDAGGTLFADDATGIADSGFDGWFRKQAAAVYPREKLGPLPNDHTLFRSFYFLDRIGGRTLIKDEIEGVTVGDRSPIIYCVNDVGGAWATDLFGKPLAQCVPGGERQREMAWRMGVNLFMYTLCMNYKKERAHVETILERRKLR